MKRRIAALLAAAMLAAAAPTLAETMRIGDQAVVKKCKEYITLREADNVQATELARIPLGNIWATKPRALRRSPSRRRSAATSICF